MQTEPLMPTFAPPALSPSFAHTLADLTVAREEYGARYDREKALMGALRGDRRDASLNATKADLAEAQAALRAAGDRVAQLRRRREEERATHRLVLDRAAVEASAHAVAEIEQGLRHLDRAASIFAGVVGEYERLGIQSLPRKPSAARQFFYAIAEVRRLFDLSGRA